MSAKEGKNYLWTGKRFGQARAISNGGIRQGADIGQYEKPVTKPTTLVIEALSYYITTMESHCIGKQVLWPFVIRMICTAAGIKARGPFISTAILR